MIPAPVRPVPQPDRWCLRLLTSMQRDRDTVIPLVAVCSVPAGCCERAGMPIMGRRRSPNTANQRLGTLDAQKGRICQAAAWLVVGSVCPGGLFVIGGSVFEAAVEYPDEAVLEGS